MLPGSENRPRYTPRREPETPIRFRYLNKENITLLPFFDNSIYGEIFLKPQ
jgi:hypothetical protein